MCSVPVSLCSSRVSGNLSRRRRGSSDSGREGCGHGDEGCVGGRKRVRASVAVWDRQT